MDYARHDNEVELVAVCVRLGLKEQDRTLNATRLVPMHPAGDQDARLRRAPPSRQHCVQRIPLGVMGESAVLPHIKLLTQRIELREDFVGVGATHDPRGEPRLPLG
eukprot:CAMPEP_0113239298 /NCGR_PEP_ID=MMETSP0008_2-20120614/5640_1 /TAXON_ID=97485 /ORGANISM="Prymnesium parvum" /LENGTH=105 /DNA_ID=CAMNT_0000086533 /DNA_START=355 /DNA_END=669 /DNA_ORIENTATION=- /assembly_acc=CAM_ASM_000153